MECKNCSKLSQTLQLVNDNVAAIIAGYDILFKVVSNHETAINKLMTCTSDNTQLNSNKNVDNLSNTEHVTNNDNISNPNCKPSTKLIDNIIPADILNDTVLPASQISVGANLSIFECSNVDIDDEINDVPLDCTPLDFIDDEFLNNFSSISDETSVENVTVEDVTSVENVTKSNIASNNNGGMQLNRTFIIEGSNTETLSTNVSDYISYDRYDSAIFKLFDADKLNISTNFTEILNNRSAAYYGLSPYSYGNITHDVRDFSDNVYLQKLLNYVDIVYPRFKYNSALVQKYDTGDQFIPHHSDNEDCIEDNSAILTISLGESRTFEFLEKQTKSCHEQLILNHGDALFMSKASQNHFTHSLLKEENKKCV